MSSSSENVEKIIWNYFKNKGLNDYGVASLMGNLFAESALNPKNLQSNGNKKLCMTDDEFVIAVDKGLYTKEQFVKDSYGFGLAQWTYHTRKKALYEYIKSKNKSIGDLEAQLDFLYKELSEGYKSVLNTLKSATSTLQASNAVLLKYERPADQSVNVQNKRAGYGQKYYDKYANKNIAQGSGDDSMKIKVSELIALFEQMYKEHWSYVWGAARKGCVDCSGAFVYAYKQFGQSIYHGSNRIARKYVGDLKSIDNAKAGWAAFKWKKDGAPSDYTDGKGNFYHIGLVDRTCKMVLNAKGTNSGFCLDPIDTWDYVAPLKAVNYSEIIIENTVTETFLYKATVNTQGGSLNFRKSPSGTKIGTIPNGTIIDVLNDDNSNWWKIQYNSKTGYVSTEYLKTNASENSSASTSTSTSTSIPNSTNVNYNVGDRVKLVSGATYTSGKTIRSWVFNKTLYVREIRGNNAVISTLKTGDVTGVVALKDLIKIDSFTSYQVKVIANTLNIRSGAGTNYSRVGKIEDNGVYTIVAESDGTGATKWGKLKSDKGWISLDYVIRL